MMTAEQVSLFASVKDYLGITWSNPVDDRKVADGIASGIAYLNGKAGYIADYSQPGYPRTLLFEYVRYWRDSALDVFENNYRSMILAMQNEVNDDVESPESSE